MTKEQSAIYRFMRRLDKARRRRERAIKLRESGMTFAQIGIKLGGITRQRAQQIVSEK